MSRNSVTDNGIVEVLRSPTNKFLVLLNATFEEKHDWGLHHTLRTGSNELFLQVSSRMVQQRHYTDVEEDTVYLQLLLITIASLVLVVFVVSIIFSCWWIKSRQESNESIPCYTDASEKSEYAEDCRINGNRNPNGDGEIELISLGQNIFNTYGSDKKKGKITGGEYTTFSALSDSKDDGDGDLEGREADINESRQSAEGNVTLPGTTHTLPRYTIAGNNGTSCGGNAIIGVQPSLVSSTVSSASINTFGASLPRMSEVERVGLMSMKPGHSSTTGRTRHVAKEFLDESVLNTATRKLKTPTEQVMRRPPLSNIVSTVATSSTAPQKLILLQPTSSVAPGGEQTFLLASTADGIMRPLSPIRVVEAIESTASVLNSCEIHSTTTAAPSATLFVKVDSSQNPVGNTEIQRLSPSLHTSAAGVPLLTGDFLAEMAACPQHSYLFRQQMNTTFEPPQPITGLPSTSPVPSANVENTSPTPAGEVAVPTEAPPAPAMRRKSQENSHTSNEHATEKVFEAFSHPTSKASEPPHPRQASPGCSETLPRSIGRSSSHSASIESKLNRPGSSATLPAGGASTGARKSALKGAGGSKVSKQIRFTVLNIVTISCIITIAVANKTPDGSFDNDIGIQSMNIIRFPTRSIDGNTTGIFSTKAFGTPKLKITIWLPSYFILGETESKHTVTTQSPGNSVLERKPPKSIQLWLNRTSRTEVHLGPGIHRSAVEIYDAVDARWIQSTRSCRQRYVCDHSCDPGAGHACICQRGFRPAGPEDRNRLTGFGGGSTDAIKGQGRICLDVDECEDASIRAECTQRGGVCTNRPGDHQCLCPSGRTCLRELFTSNNLDFTKKGASPIENHLQSFSYSNQAKQ
nr:hemicentin 1 [Hymenolepis microstoma]